MCRAPSHAPLQPGSGGARGADARKPDHDARSNPRRPVEEPAAASQDSEQRDFQNPLSDPQSLRQARQCDHVEPHDARQYRQDRREPDERQQDCDAHQRCDEQHRNRAPALEPYHRYFSYATRRSST